MNSEVAAYSVLGAGWPCNGWQGSSGIGSNRAEIKEIDVSNGSESGRNAAAISGRNMASLCHERPYDLLGLSRKLNPTAAFTHISFMVID